MPKTQNAALVIAADAPSTRVSISGDSGTHRHFFQIPRRRLACAADAQASRGSRFDSGVDRFHLPNQRGGNSSYTLLPNTTSLSTALRISAVATSGVVLSSLSHTLFTYFWLSTTITKEAPTLVQPRNPKNGRHWDSCLRHPFQLRHHSFVAINLSHQMFPTTASVQESVCHISKPIHDL